jgi:4-amino-4-deoxy-L-arabinose transferase-like glycosyltransferase
MIADRFLCSRNWGAFLFVLCLAVSLLFCFISPCLMGDTSGLDPDGYGSAGRVLYETGQFDSIEKAPLYPAFVALVSWLTGGYRVWVIQVAQCLLAALTGVLLYVIFRRTLEEPCPRWAGLACALYPMLIWYTPRLWTETFLTFVLAGFTLSVTLLLQKPTARRAALCGAMAGVAALSKGIAIVFLLIVPVLLLVVLWKRAWRSLLPFGLAAALLLVPWGWRNWHLTGQIVPVHANGGYNFYIGNRFVHHWPQAPLSYTQLWNLAQQDIDARYESLDLALPIDPLLADRVLLQAALDDVRACPLFILEKLAVQSLTFWYLAADAPKSLLTGVVQVPIVLAALPAILLVARRRPQALVLLVPVAGIAGVSVVVFAFARLSATIMPYLVALAVLGSGEAIHGLRLRARSR